MPAPSLASCGGKAAGSRKIQENDHSARSQAPRWAYISFLDKTHFNELVEGTILRHIGLHKIYHNWPRFAAESFAIERRLFFARYRSNLRAAAP